MKDNNACVANDEWSPEGREPRYKEQASSLVRPNTADTHASKGCRRRSGGGGRRAAKVREHMGGCPEVLTGGQKKKNNNKKKKGEGECSQPKMLQPKMRRFGGRAETVVRTTNDIPFANPFQTM